MNFPLFGWRLTVVSGVLLGIAVELAETPTLPVSDLTAPELPAFSFQFYLPWLIAGLLWAWGAWLAENRGVWILITLMPITTAAQVLVTIGFKMIAPRMSTSTGQLLSQVPLGDLAPYFIWTNLVYGYLYAASYLAARRRMRSRALLAAQRRERSVANGDLREAQLASLRGQLQPDLLVEALQMLQLRFARSEIEGDALFDMIVGSLRAAMPGVRNHVSVLAAELETMRRYSALREALGQTGVRVSRVDPRAGDIALPPLLLLPLVDLLARAARAGDGPKVTMSVVDDRYLTTVTAEGARAPIAAALDALDAGVTGTGGRVDVSRQDLRIEIVVSLPFRAAGPNRFEPILVA